MVLPHTSKLSFISSSGQPLNAPREWEPAHLELKFPPDQWEQIKVWRNGNHLDPYLKKINGKKHIIADWQRSNPGNYRIKVECNGEIEEQVITVLPRKISPEAFTQMLEDLDTRLPISIAIALQRLHKNSPLAGIQLSSAKENHWEQEVIRLSRAINGTKKQIGLVEILNRLAQDPHQIFKTNEIWVQRENVRRPSPSGLIQAVSRGHNLDDKSQPIYLPDLRVQHTVDVYENQIVKMFYELVFQRTLRLRNIFKDTPKGKPLDEVELLLKQLKKARKQATFIDEVSQLKQEPNNLTMVLLKRPVYSAALEGYLNFRKNFTVKLEESDLDTPLEKLYNLYQLWASLWLIETLLEVAIQQGYQVEKNCLLVRDKTGMNVRVLPDGKPAVILIHPEHKTRVGLIPERTYGKYGELRSTTDFQHKPDLVLEITLFDGSQQIYLFDPKYKLIHEENETRDWDGKPKKSDIDKMHAYRDAIVDKKENCVVRYAAILYPGSFMSDSRAKVQALPAYPGKETELKEHLRRILDKALNVL
ncbi:DUF2357 domain-containing protein [Aerosakkonemataceae cyanobacterium BLCC-F154]|uniref:DUF2357 domain-containing protein n=1 Tax=Floridaenema fluviatile BLCC-F154 TaxID=3153640 RepID=A0ABV4YCM5_9CYAN